MKLHLIRQDFKDLVEAAAQHLNLRPVFVEKDYWVTYVLKNLANSPHVNNVVFKGGTSLSKAYGIIDRFSEDIDLAVLSPSSYSDGKMKALLKQVSADITPGLTPIPGHQSEVKFGRNRTTAYEYPKLIQDNNFGIVKPYILVEINCFTNPVPHLQKPVQTYIAQFLQEQGNNQAINEFELQPVSVNVLSLERTYFEKVLSVNRLSYDGPGALIEKVRHFFDMYKLQTSPAQGKGILIPENFQILALARQDDENNRTMQGDWMSRPISASPLFAQLETIWESIIPAYRSDLAQLVWSNNIPVPDDVLKALMQLKKYLENFDKQFPPRIGTPS
jgi:predicted nucleotidyltransferase component of viral defense system